MSEAVAKNAKAGLLMLAAAVGALLLILAAGMISARPASADVIGSSASGTVPEAGILTSSGTRTPWVDTGKTLQPGQSVEIKADPSYTIWSGVWLTGQN